MKNKSTIAPPFQNAFTLIEILIVIAIIAIIAGLLIPVFSAVVRKATIQHAQAERDALETAIERYHSKYGFYPPGNAAASAANLPAALTNQLYYELEGTSTTNGGTTYTTLDQSSTVSTTPVNYFMQYFGVSGIMNCTKGSGEDSVPAQNFIGNSLKGGQIATNTDGVFVIVTAVNSGPTYKPIGSGFASFSGYNTPNPWRYLYPGVNNHGSYDLWIQIIVGGRTNLICNWKDQPTYNSLLP